jgi:acetyltransferase-like isoleucine patch superfamily enzyme
MKTEGRCHLPHDWFPRALPDDIELGARTWLYSSYAFHHNQGRVRIGPDCGIYNGTQFELGPDGEVEIGAFTTVVGAIIASNGRVTIGDHCFVAHEVFIAGGPFAGPPEAIPPLEIDPPIEIGAGAWIGTRAVLLAGARIGENAVVGAGAIVREEVPAGATAAGNPLLTHSA